MWFVARPAFKSSPHHVEWIFVPVGESLKEGDNLEKRLGLAQSMMDCKRVAVCGPMFGLLHEPPDLMSIVSGNEFRLLALNDVPAIQIVSLAHGIFPGGSSISRVKIAPIRAAASQMNRRAARARVQSRRGA